MTMFQPNALAMRPAQAKAVSPAGPVAAPERLGADFGFDSLFQRAVERSSRSAGAPLASASDGAVGNSTDGRHGAGADRDESRPEELCGADRGTGEGNDSLGDRRNKNGNADLSTPRNDSIIQDSQAAASRCATSCGTASTGVFGIPEEELKKLVRVLRCSAVSGRRGVSLTLSLGELGEVRFNVRLDGDAVFIQAAVGDQRAAAALTISLGELEKRLAECDLTLGGFEIAVGCGPRRKPDGGRGVAVTVTALTQR